MEDVWTGAGPLRYVLTGLAAGRQYYVQVRAVNADGDGPWSATVTFFPDRAALVALYNATDGPNWEYNANWLSDAPLREWYGVGTDSGGRVVWLSLTNNGLNGTIPPELGSLTNLSRLYLDGNQLSGSIPVELGSLTNLTSLYLGGNQLSGEIPAELGRLTNLTYLYLRGNSLTGCVPEGLRDIQSHDLYRLDLPFCDMTGGSPVVVIRFVSAAGTPVRPDSGIALEATFSEPVSGFSLEDISVANGMAANFSGNGAVYTFSVTPSAIGEVTVNIAAGVAEDADGNGNIAARLPLGIPYDDDYDGKISKDEAIMAVIDYFAGRITKEEAIAIIILYFSS